ncbi:MAG: phasin family protein [Amphiplicatus sp.]
MAAKKTVARKAVKPAEPAAGTDDPFAIESASTAARDQFERLASLIAENAETMRGQAEDLIDTVQGNLDSARERFTAVNADMLDAAREEASEAVDFIHSLARAKTIGEALEIQRDYWAKLFETRVERTQAFTKASVDAARESFEPFSKSLSAIANNAAFEKFMPFGAK